MPWTAEDIRTEVPHNEAFYAGFSEYRETHKLGASGSIYQTNHNDMQWTGKVYIGSDKQVNEMVYDTGSAWLVVETAGCATCLNATYTGETSTNYKQLTRAEAQLTYGSAQI
jgi:hypothetical protein